MKKWVSRENEVKTKQGKVCEQNAMWDLICLPSVELILWPWASLQAAKAERVTGWWYDLHSYMQ